MSETRKHCTSCNLPVEKAQEARCPGGSTCLQGRSVQEARQLNVCRMCGAWHGHHEGCPMPRRRP